MDKQVKYELLFIKSITVFYLFGIVSSIFMSKELLLFNKLVTIGSIFLLIASINCTKLLMISKNIFTNRKYFVIIRIIELIILISISKISNYSIWAYIGIIITITMTSISVEPIIGYLFAFGTSALNLIISIIFYRNRMVNIIQTNDPINLIYFDILFGTALILITFLSGMIRKNNIETEYQNKMLLKEVEEKYELLAVAQQEIKDHYDKMKYTNKKLEDTNLKLSNSIGEFYTLHQISQAISSILNIKELLRYVNDVIIGVMGVQYCTIAIFDEKKGKLKVQTTNITDNENLFDLSSNINCNQILESLDNGKPIVNNYVNGSSYAFISGREVNSFICMPLINKTRKLGIVLIEHKLNNTFGDDKKRLIDIICQQVSIAIENAELYQKMHELAITDWLTGVYNRVYFQQRLSRELNIAIDNGYDICVGIFDIDLFKKFNDTYGHIFGDKVIKTVAEVVRESLRSTDLIARYGGEEFIILMPRTTLDEAYAKLEYLRAKIQNTIIRDELITVSVTASFGVAGFPANCTTEKELLKNADSALYEAKNTGRNCVKVYS